MIPTPVLILRECRKCGWRGPLTSFIKAKSCRFGRAHTCLVCARTASLAYAKTEHGRQSHDAARAKFNAKPKTEEQKQSLRDASVRYYWNHHEQSLETAKEYRESPEGSKARADYRKSEAGKAASDKYARSPKGLESRKRHANKPETKAKNAVKRQLRRLGVESNGVFELAEECCYCGTAEAKLTLEHIIPINWAVGGMVPSEPVCDSHNWDTACHSCNSSKGDRLPDIPKFLDRASGLLGFDVREKFEEKHFWVPPALQ